MTPAIMHARVDAILGGTIIQELGHVIFVDIPEGNGDISGKWVWVQPDGVPMVGILHGSVGEVTDFIKNQHPHLKGCSFSVESLTNPAGLDAVPGLAVK